MKALILNSGTGSRMGKYTEKAPKCMNTLSGNITIIERQLRQLCEYGISKIIITVGPHSELLEHHVMGFQLPADILFVRNDDYINTNYIYSIYLAKEYLDDDLLLLHGDLVFNTIILGQMIKYGKSCMAVSSSVKLPEKDFKAVLHRDRIVCVGIEFFDNAVAAQPIYMLKHNDWMLWLEKIVDFCNMNHKKCYAENALNLVTDRMCLYPFDYKDLFCQEVDVEEDLRMARGKLMEHTEKGLSL